LNPLSSRCLEFNQGNIPYRDQNLVAAPLCAAITVQKISAYAKMMQSMVERLTYGVFIAA
jgi:hypothetical protein